MGLGALGPILLTKTQPRPDRHPAVLPGGSESFESSPSCRWSLSTVSYFSGDCHTDPYRIKAYVILQEVIHRYDTIGCSQCYSIVVME